MTELHYFWPMHLRNTRDFFQISVLCDPSSFWRISIFQLGRSPLHNSFRYCNFFRRKCILFINFKVMKLLLQSWFDLCFVALRTIPHISQMINGCKLPRFKTSLHDWYLSRLPENSEIRDKKIWLISFSISFRHCYKDEKNIHVKSDIFGLTAWAIKG